VRANAKENCQTSLLTTVLAARDGGRRPHLALRLQEGCKSENIQASTGVIWVIQANTPGRAPVAGLGRRAMQTVRISCGCAMKSKVKPWRVMSLCFLGAVLTATMAQHSALADDQATIDKDSVKVITANISGSQDAPKDKQLQWKPGISFRVNGPIADGSQLWVEFGYLDRKDWAKYDCRTRKIPAGASLMVRECLASDKFTTPYVGPVDFSIHLRNELQGTAATLFTGKAMVGKVIGPAGPQYPEFYVDEDWRIPIGYVFYEHSSGHSATFLNVGFWYRGNPPTVEAHLFYKGKEIAKSEIAGNEGSDWNPAKHQWGFANCQFVGVYKDDPGNDGYDPRFWVAKNPGEYEVKVLVAHHLARSIKFTVNGDGSFDNGIARANKLGSDRVIVPVQVIGNQGPWDQTAWKAGAFYGNPLTGFTAVP
jgi:hypothetical protein